MSRWTQGRRARRLLLGASIVMAALTGAFSRPVATHAQIGGQNKTSSRLERVLPNAVDTRDLRGRLPEALGRR